MKNLNQYYGSNGQFKSVIETPDYLKDKIVKEFGEYFDPCPVNPSFDGLLIDWPTNIVNYVNPPYTRGQISKWVKKCFDEFQRGCKIVLLIPAYTDTSYFHTYIYQVDPFIEIRFLKGRVKFKGYDKSASFPSMLVIFDGWREFP
tara:strand:+ start:1288 stop:1722 length:435 start_codon:yes stop_codon:yes gene_type:complete